MNKTVLIRKIVAYLEGELELYKKAAKAAHAEATHEQSKAENKYDTRGLEAAYLARGQSKQAAEIIQAIAEYQKLVPKKFSASDPIDVSALVETETGKERTLYFVGPKAGGTEIVHDKKEILVITLQSPLGQQLAGRKQGDRLKFELAGERREVRILTVE